MLIEKRRSSGWSSATLITETSQFSNTYLFQTDAHDLAWRHGKDWLLPLFWSCCLSIYIAEHSPTSGIKTIKQLSCDNQYQNLSYFACFFWQGYQNVLGVYCKLNQKEGKRGEGKWKSEGKAWTVLAHDSRKWDVISEEVSFLPLVRRSRSKRTTELWWSHYSLSITHVQS